MGGFSVITGDPLGTVMNADNVSFDGTSRGGVVTTNGQLLIGSTATPHIKVGTLGSSDGSITWTVGSGTITGQVTGGTSVLKTLTGNSGGAISPTAGNINVVTANATAKFVGSASTLTQDFNLTNLVLGSALPAVTTGDFNVGLGFNCLSSVTASQNNVAIGYAALATAADVASGNNVAIGYQSLTVGTGGGNISIGKDCMSTATTAQGNVCIGTSAALNLLTGARNICIGGSSGQGLIAAESNNVLISNSGTTSESNAIHIGDQGSGSSQQNKCFIAGITGVTVSNPLPVFLNSSTGQLGVGSSTIVSTWTDVTGATQTLAVGNGYFTDRGGGVTFTLPATAALGDIIKIDGKLGLATIAQNANQSIRVSSAISTVGVTGTVVSTNVGDCITLRCSTAGASTVWVTESMIGNWTVS